MRKIRDQKDKENFIKQNILYITSLENDLPKIDNIQELSKNFNLFILTVKESHFKLWVVNDNKFIFIVFIHIFKTLRNNDFR